MPERIKTSTGLTETQHDWMLSGGWFEFTDGFEAWAKKEIAIEWKRNRRELLDECREKFGLFKRPYAFWQVEVVDLGDSTEAKYLLDHPELQTAEERESLKAHGIPKWLLREHSEWYSPEEYLRGQGLQHYLDPDEMEDLGEFIKVRDRNIGIM